jgi:hypothetical protein
MNIKNENKPVGGDEGDNASGSGGPGWPEACRREETIRKLLGRSEGERLKMGDVEEVALELGVSPATLYRLIRQPRKTIREVYLAATPDHGVLGRTGPLRFAQQGWPLPDRRTVKDRVDEIEALRRTRCGCSRREKRFLNLNVRGREPLSKFSNKMSNALANRGISHNKMYPDNAVAIAHCTLVSFCRETHKSSANSVFRAICVCDFA